jgi:hypothetical protein
MATQRVPSGLGTGGRSLWKAITDAHELDAAQKVQLEEACRAKDRCDRLDEILRGDLDAWMCIEEPENRPAYLKIDAALTKANETANLMKQLLAALRLPDEQSGKRPQQRTPRGSYTPGGKAGSSRGRLAAAS